MSDFPIVHLNTKYGKIEVVVCSGERVALHGRAKVRLFTREYDIFAHCVHRMADGSWRPDYHYPMASQAMTSAARKAFCEEFSRAWVVYLNSNPGVLDEARVSVLRSERGRLERLVEDAREQLDEARKNLDEFDCTHPSIKPEPELDFVHSDFDIATQVGSMGSGPGVGKSSQ